MVTSRKAYKDFHVTVGDWVLVNKLARASYPGGHTKVWVGRACKPFKAVVVGITHRFNGIIEEGDIYNGMQPPIYLKPTTSICFIKVVTGLVNNPMLVPQDGFVKIFPEGNKLPYQGPARIKTVFLKG